LTFRDRQEYKQQQQQYPSLLKSQVENVLYVPDNKQHRLKAYQGLYLQELDSLIVVNDISNSVARLQRERSAKTQVLVFLR
jgi:hypothetical protein